MPSTEEELDRKTFLYNLLVPVMNKYVCVSRSFYRASSPSLHVRTHAHTCGGVANWIVRRIVNVYVSMSAYTGTWKAWTKGGVCTCCS